MCPSGFREVTIGKHEAVMACPKTAHDFSGGDGFLPFVETVFARLTRRFHRNVAGQFRRRIYAGGMEGLFLSKLAMYQAVKAVCDAKPSCSRFWTRRNRFSSRMIWMWMSNTKSATSASSRWNRLKFRRKKLFSISVCGTPLVLRWRNVCRRPNPPRSSIRRSLIFKHHRNPPVAVPPNHNQNKSKHEKESIVRLHPQQRPQPDGRGVSERSLR